MGVFVHLQNSPASYNWPRASAPYQGQIAMSAMVSVAPGDELVLCQALVQHIHLALDLHGKAVMGYSNFSGA